MKVEIPELERDDFARHLQEASPEELQTEAMESLFAHYKLLRHWNRRLSLIGGGTASEVIARHYGEALAALPWIEEAAGEALDLGSGAGFPGFVLAAVRRHWHWTLVDSRQKKWAFLKAACRAARLSCNCLNARVGPLLPAGLPERVDLVTLRAVRLEEDWLLPLLGRLSPNGSVLLWFGGGHPGDLAGWAVCREMPLPGSDRRRLLELKKAR